MLCPYSARRVELEVWRALKMAQVAGDERQTIMDRRRRNQHVWIADELPKASDASEAFQDYLVEWEDHDGTEELPEACLRTLRVATVVDALLDLTEGDKADGEPPGTEGCKQRRRLGFAS